MFADNGMAFLKALERQFSRAIDAGHPEDDDVSSMIVTIREQLLLSIITAFGPVDLRVDRSCFIDPPSPAITVNTGGTDVNNS